MDEEIMVKKTFKNTSKAGKEYLSVLTDKGKMSCWNGVIFPSFIAGNRLLVKVEEKNGYKNILGIEKDLPNHTIKSNWSEPSEKSAGMLTSYVKDIVVAMIEKGIQLKDEEAKKLAEQVADWYQTIKQRIGGENDHSERPIDPISP